MRVARGAPYVCALVLAVTAAEGQPATPTTPPAPAARGEGMRAYHTALNQRRLGLQDLKLEDLRDRLAEAEALVRDGRTDEAVSRMTEVVEHPRFELYAEGEEGRAAVWLLGDALANAGAYDP